VLDQVREDFCWIFFEVIKGQSHFHDDMLLFLFEKEKKKVDTWVVHFLLLCLKSFAKHIIKSTLKINK
jgi:hypothetical protein